MHWPGIFQLIKQYLGPFNDGITEANQKANDNAQFAARKDIKPGTVDETEKSCNKLASAYRLLAFNQTLANRYAPS